MQNKIRGFKEGILLESITSVGGFTHKKGSKIRYKKYKCYADKDGYLFSDYEYHILDENNYNLIRTTRLLIEGVNLPDLRKEFEKKYGKN